MSYPKSGKAIGKPQEYEGHRIQAWFYGPDFLCIVDGNELPAFYETANHALKGGMRYVDNIKKAH